MIVPERITQQTPQRAQLPMPYVPFYQEQRFRAQIPQHRRRTIEGEVDNVRRVAHAVGNACEAVLGVFAELRNAGWIR